MLFEKLTEREVNIIEDWILEYGANYDSDVYESYRAPLKTLLRYWDEAKSEYLYSLFGQNFILERPITYTIPQYKLEAEIAESKSHGEMRSFWTQFRTFCASHYLSFSDEYFYCMELVSGRWLAKNKTTLAEPVVLQITSEHKITLDSNTKPIRALGKIAKWIDLEESFEQFRIAHSQILNQKQLQGTLCLSIHPMDYLTMSDNMSKWGSCMSWANRGSYRMGTVEMMNSPCVVVGYLKSEKDYYQWNDKMWRCLFVVTPEIITSIKAYPYHNEEFIRTVIEWLRDLYANNFGQQFGEIENIPDCDIWKSKNGNYYYFRPECGVMYNDFGCADHFGVLPAILPGVYSVEQPNRISIYYSGETECMCCGCIAEGSIYDESFVYCADCCSNYDGCNTCDRCGERWDSDDMYWISDSCYCPDCFDDVGVYSYMAGDNYYWEDITKIYVIEPGEEPEKTDEFIYCPSNWLNRLKFAAYNAERYTHLDAPHCTDDGLYYVYADELTELGYRCWVQS